jgi:hypothetical protein
MATPHFSSPAEILAYLAHFRGSRPFRPEGANVPGVFPAELKQALQLLKQQGYADKTPTERGEAWWITGAGLIQAQYLNSRDVQPSPPDPVTAARYATTLWELHWASFCHQEAFIFPKNRPGPQTALAVRSWAEAEILLKTAFTQHEPGSMSSLGGRYLSEPGDGDSLLLIHPWDPVRGQALVQGMHTLCITMVADRSNLQELAFQLHREFNFVANILEELYTAYLKGSRIMANQWRARGWAAIPGYREALGPIGRETSPQPDDDGSFLMDPKDAMDLMDKFLNRTLKMPRPSGSPCQGKGQDNQSDGRTS